MGAALLLQRPSIICTRARVSSVPGQYTHNTTRQLFAIHTLYQSNTDTTLSLCYSTTVLLHLGEELLPVCHGSDELGLGGDEAGQQPLAGVDEGPAQLPPRANRGSHTCPNVVNIN